MMICYKQQINNEWIMKKINQQYILSEKLLNFTKKVKKLRPDDIKNCSMVMNTGYKLKIEDEHSLNE